MAPFRASRSTRSDRRTGGHAEADVFDGLPVRQWRLHESIVAPPPSLDTIDPAFGANVPPGNVPGMQQKNIQRFNKWTAELPMPKGSELYAPWCQQLLRAARAGRVRKRADDDCLQPARDEDKESGEDNETTQQTELKGFMARRWTQLPRQMERPEQEHLAKRRKGLASVVPLPGMPGMIGNDGQGAAAEGALNQPIVEERKRNMPPRRKPKKGPKKKKMSDGAGLGVSASAEALAASHATSTAPSSAGETETNVKPDGQDVAMQDAEDAEDDVDEGESGEEEDDDEEVEGEESEAAQDTSDPALPSSTTTDSKANGTIDANPSSKRPQHPLANEITATEAMIEPTAEDPQAPPPVPAAVEAVSAPEPISKLEHDLIPELTDEPIKEESPAISQARGEAGDHVMADADEIKPAVSSTEDSGEVAEAKHPISAAELHAMSVPHVASATSMTEAVEDRPLEEPAGAAPRSMLEAEAMEQDAIAGRDDTAQQVPAESDVPSAPSEPAPAVQAAQVPVKEETPAIEPIEATADAVDNSAPMVPSLDAATLPSEPDVAGIQPSTSPEQAIAPVPIVDPPPSLPVAAMAPVEQASALGVPTAPEAAVESVTEEVPSQAVAIEEPEAVQEIAPEARAPSPSILPPAPSPEATAEAVPVAVADPTPEAAAEPTAEAPALAEALAPAPAPEAVQEAPAPPPPASIELQLAPAPAEPEADVMQAAAALEEGEEQPAAEAAAPEAAPEADVGAETAAPAETEAAEEPAAEPQPQPHDA